MSNNIVSIRSGLILFYAVTAMAGCSNGETLSQSTLAGRTHSANLGMASYGMIERDALRVRRDVLRQRLWVLTFDEVRVYDTARKRKRLIRKIELPNWSAARFICDPDMVLDGAGSAIISSNVRASLWQIDADSFALREREIRLHGREQWDTGFRALTFAADGALLALASMEHSWWKIDLTQAKASASRIGLDNPPSNACAITAPLLNDVERSQQR